ncbi:MAG: cytochrome c biogenesis protein CcsA [Kiloniellaceae bacterium]
MPKALFLSLSGLISLVPGSVLSYRREAPRPDVVFWAVTAAAVAGPTAAAVAQLGDTWQTGLSLALWISVAASMAIFALLALIDREAWRLMPLLLPYLLLLGVLATVWSNVPGRAGLSAPPDAWLTAHIAVSVATYGLCTIAAVAGAAVLLQERAVKRKRPSALTHRLPSISDASRLQLRLLAASEGVLALGILTGMAEQRLTSGHLLEFDHKTLLSILAFAVIGLLLVVHQRTGLRGQRAARLVLLAYLLLTLAYPGVKFVTDVLIG